MAGIAAVALGVELLKRREADTARDPALSEHRSARERLHALVDQLSEDDAQAILAAVTDAASRRP